MSNSTIPVLLCGGMGTRLRPALKDLPKPLAPVLGRPFLAYLLDQLLEAGFTRAVLSTGYKREILSDMIGSELNGISIQYVEETSPLGTGGALKSVMDQVEAEEYLVMNGDSYLGLPFPEFLEFPANQFQALLALAKVEDCGRYGTVSTNATATIQRFEEKKGIPKSGEINAGIYRIQSSMRKYFPRQEAFSLERDIFEPLSKTALLGGISYKAPFIDIGTPESLKAASTFFRQAGYTDA
ncbi:MAG: sugar phosphate nucleotidyltransferase [Opitutae bacterium]